MRMIRLFVALVGGLGGLLAAAGGCHRPPGEATVPQTEAFAAIDKLVSQVEALPDATKRTELMATLDILRAQLTFGDLKIPPAGRLLLAREIQILPMTQVADWNNDGELDGFEVLLRATDSFGDTTKIVGKLYFELFAFRQAHADPRGSQRMAYWEVNLDTPENCNRFWNPFQREYQFNLVWPKAPEVGVKYVFQVTYVAPWGECLDSRRILTRSQ